MAPADAKRIKEQGKVLLLIEPREPFKMAGSHVIVEPSFSSPYKVTENYELILGNITCAMIADDQVKVYGSWDTN